MDDLRCVASYMLRDMRAAIAFLTEVVGFKLDVDRVDNPPEESMAILRRGDVELRLFAAPESTLPVEIVFTCNSAEDWKERFESAGFEPVVYQDVGDPVTVECQITDELRVTLEESDIWPKFA